MKTLIATLVLGSGLLTISNMLGCSSDPPAAAPTEGTESVTVTPPPSAIAPPVDAPTMSPTSAPTSTPPAPTSVATAAPTASPTASPVKGEACTAASDCHGALPKICTTKGCASWSCVKNVCVIK